MSEDSLFVIHCIQHINKATTCKRNNNAEHNTEEILDSLNGEVKT
jgi:hypothetical protein